MKTGNVVLAVVNIVLFAFWLSLVHVEATSPKKDTVWVYDAISFQITILEVMLAAFTIILAVMAFFGFQFLLERAVSRADRAAREAVHELYGQGQVIHNQSSSGGSGTALPTAAALPKDSATKEGEV